MEIKFKINNFSLSLTSNYIVLKEAISNNIHLINLKNGKTIAFLELGPNEEFNNMVIDGIYGKIISMHTLNGNILIWNWQEGILHKHKYGNVYEYCYGDNDEYFFDYNKELIVLLKNGKIIAINIKNNKILWEDDIYSNNFEISSDNKYVFYFKKENLIIKRDLLTKEIVGEFACFNKFELTSEYLVVSSDLLKTIKVVNLQKNIIMWETNYPSGNSKVNIIEIINNKYVHVTFSSNLHVIYNLQNGKILFQLTDKSNINFNTKFLFLKETNEKESSIFLNPLEALDIFYKELSTEQIQLIYDIYNMDQLIKQIKVKQGLDISSKINLKDNQIKAFISLPKFFQRSLLSNFSWLYHQSKNNNNNNDHGHDYIMQ